MRVGAVVGLVEQLREMETDSMSIVSCMHIHVYVNFLTMPCIHYVTKLIIFFFLSIGNLITSSIGQDYLFLKY